MQEGHNKHQTPAGSCSDWQHFDSTIPGGSGQAQFSEGASRTKFQYDRAGRLGGANAPNYDGAGGYGYKRVYRYDTRSNRTKTEQYASTGYAFLYNSGLSWGPDRLTRMATHDGTTADPVLAMARDSAGAATVEVRSGRNRDFVYDGAGRVTAIKGASVHGPPATSPVLVSLNFDNSGQPPTGTETVMRVATTQAGSFNYFYDAQNRRVRKQYPNGDLDGFFWGDGRELLMETSPTSINGGKRTMDEYLWLAGRPVVTIRSKYDSSASWTRFAGLNDWYTDCERRDEAGTCRPNAIISDVIGKPIATLDSSRKVAGVLEYDPFGHINRAEHWGEIAPAQNGGCWWVTSWMKQGMGPLAREVRAMVPRVDLNDYVPGVKGGCIGQYKSTPWQQPSSAPAGNDFCGPKTDYRFPWTTLADNEGLHVLYCSYENNISPQPFGVTVRGYEYRKREVGTSAHYLPPFRFPGQYFDAETDLYENWNRYYDPSTGRYLNGEPMLQEPTWVRRELKKGQQVPVYSYARNNPIRYVDRNGLSSAAAAAGFYFIPWSSAAAAAVAGWGSAAASVGATAAGAGVVAGVFAAANAGIGMFHDPGAGIPYPPVGAPALPHPSDASGVGDLPIPAPVCMAGPRVPKECRDNYKQCRQAGGRWTSLLQCEYCRTRCIDLGHWPWPAAGGVSGMEVCNYTGPYESAE